MGSNSPSFAPRKHSLISNTLRRTACTFLALGFSAMGCVAMPEESFEDSGVDERSDGSKGALTVPSTTLGNERFRFCPNRARSDSAAKNFNVSLINAYWLAAISANEYAHYANIGPWMGKLGFGKVRASCGGSPCLEGKRWILRARDVLAKRRKYGRDSAEAAKYERGILQVAKADEWIQFFTAGHIQDNTGTFKDGTTQAMVARHRKGGFVVVGFRGTEMTRPDDLMADADARLVPFGRGWGHVHRGFAAAIFALRTNGSKAGLVVDRLRLFRRGGENPPIWLTGHSLGGGLATLQAAQLLNAMERGEPFNLKGVYTYGSPRVGDATFRARFTALAKKHGVQVMRFRHGNDVVSYVPTGLYRHVGRMMFLRCWSNHPSCNGVFQPGHGKLVSDLDKPGQTSALGSSWNPLDDHSIENSYAPRIAELRNRRHGAVINRMATSCENM